MTGASRRASDSSATLKQYQKRLERLYMDTISGSTGVPPLQEYQLLEQQVNQQQQLRAPTPQHEQHSPTQLSPSIQQQQQQWNHSQFISQRQQLQHQQIIPGSGGDLTFVGASSNFDGNPAFGNLPENLQQLHLVPSRVDESQPGSTGAPFPHGMVASNALNLSKIDEAFQENSDVGFRGDAGGVNSGMQNTDGTVPEPYNESLSKFGPASIRNDDGVMDSDDALVPGTTLTLVPHSMSCQAQASRILDPSGKKDFPTQDQAVASLSSLIDMNQ